MKTDLTVLPKVRDVYITMLPGNDFREVANKAKELVQSGFNPVPHFPARSIKNFGDLKGYVSMCKDFGVKQALVIGGSAEPIGDYHCSLQILESKSGNIECRFSNFCLLVSYKIPTRLIATLECTRIFLMSLGS